MAKYFKKFPKISYNLNEYNTDYITNLTTRFSIEQSLKNNVIAYYPYIVKDGDTPEIIASKLYGSVERHWVILLLNDIVDPQFDWPLPYKAFYDYVEGKYVTNAGVGQTGYQWASTNTHSYYKVITETISDVVKVKEYEIDATAYANLASSFSETISLPNSGTLNVTTTKKTKSYFEYEEEINENKKRIKLLNPDLILGFESEIEELFLNGTV